MIDRSKNLAECESADSVIAFCREFLRQENGDDFDVQSDAAKAYIIERLRGLGYAHKGVIDAPIGTGWHDSEGDLCPKCKAGTLEIKATVDDTTGDHLCNQLDCYHCDYVEGGIAI